MCLTFGPVQARPNPTQSSPVGRALAWPGKSLLAISHSLSNYLLVSLNDELPGHLLWTHLVKSLRWQGDSESREHILEEVIEEYMKAIQSEEGNRLLWVYSSHVASRDWIHLKNDRIYRLKFYGRCWLRHIESMGNIWRRRWHIRLPHGLYQRKYGCRGNLGKCLNGVGIWKGQRKRG